MGARRLRGLPIVVLLVLVGACGSSDDDAGSVDLDPSAVTSSDPPMAAADLRGTWDYTFDEDDARIILDDFEDLVADADEVVVRVGFDDDNWWLGFLFDGDLFLLDGMPEGDGGLFEIDGEHLALTGAHGEVRSTHRWAIDGDELTVTVTERCSVTPTEDVCTDDRAQIEQDDPLMILITEHTFTKSSDDPSY